jgi:hypothetical protein
MTFFGILKMILQLINNNLLFARLAFLFLLKI